MKKYRIILGILIFFLLIGGGVSLVFWQNQKKGQQYQREVDSIWKDIVRESVFLKEGIKVTNDRESLRELSRRISATNRIVGEERKKAISLSPSQSHKKFQLKLDQALRAYQGYLAQANQIIRDYLEGKAVSGLKRLKNQGSMSRKICESFVKATPFIKENIPPEAFKLFLVIQEMVKESEVKKAKALLEEAEAKAKEETEKRQQTEEPLALEVVLKWLEGEKAGGTEINWDLASNRLRQESLKDFPPDEQTKESFVQYFQEGEAHAHLVSYEVIQASILTAEKATVFYKATRQSIEGSMVPNKEEQLPLVKEAGLWRVDGVNF